MMSLSDELMLMSPEFYGDLIHLNFEKNVEKKNKKKKNRIFLNIMRHKCIDIYVNWGF